MDIPNAVSCIIQKLESAGFEAYAVGGCVRDRLLGRRPHDWDITTSAQPADVKALFPHTFDTGIQHGTVTVLWAKTAYEVTTFRVDGAYRDYRRPESVAFTQNLVEDLRRRDFTINAMAYSQARGLVDPFGGERDLRQRLIRGVGDPVLRFREDALRMLRAIRFSSQLGFTIAPDTYAAILSEAPLIAHVSRERLRDELCQILGSCAPEKLRLLLDTGLLVHMDKPLHAYLTQYAAEIDKLSVWVKDEKDEASKSELLLRLAFLLHFMPVTEAEALLRSFHFSNKEVATVTMLIAHVSDPLPLSPYEVRKQLGALGADTSQALLTLQGAVAKVEGAGALAQFEQQAAQARALRAASLTNQDPLALADLRINGRALQAMGLQGKQIGAALQYLLDMVWQNPDQNEPEALRAAALAFDETHGNI